MSLSDIRFRGTLKGTVQRTIRNYNDLINRPAINGHTLIGNQSGHALELANEDDIINVEANPLGSATADLHKILVDDTIYSIPDVVVYGTASGAIASFDDGGNDKPLKSLKIAINPVQASGTPSPENPLPISGWTGAEICNANIKGITGSSSNSLTRQFHVDWADDNNNYDMPFNVVATETVKDENDNNINVATCESEYVLPFDTVYDAPEAIYASAEDLAAGDYYFKIVNDFWGGNNGKYVSFTLDADLTAGKQIRKKSGAYNAAIEDCTLGIFTDGSDTTGTALAFTVSSTQPATGTSLGQTDGTADLNYWHCVVLGYNRWMYSAIRQFLNSDAAKNNWWVQQHKWDVMPAYATTADGFLKGMDPAVLAHIKTTEVKTARNTVFNSGDTPLGGFDTTFDRIFLAALEQMYIQPQESGEGTYWPYYKELLNVNSPVARGATYPELKKYDLAAKTTSRHRWLRSCYRGYAGGAWCVHSSGYVYLYNANYAYRCAPCLRIAINDKKSITWSEEGEVFGGELDVTSGVIHPFKYYSSYNGETLVGRWQSSMDVYAEGATPTIGAQVVDFGAYDTDISIPIPNITTLLGNNNIWSDTGEVVECVYQRDLNIVINQFDERITALEQALSGTRNLSLSNSAVKEEETEEITEEPKEEEQNEDKR